MNSTPTMFERTAARPASAKGGRAEQRLRHDAADIDSTAMRWVFAATVMFWVVVYAAGRSYF